jgi:hypothetical protein
MTLLDDDSIAHKYTETLKFYKIYNRIEKIFNRLNYSDFTFSDAFSYSKIKRSIMNYPMTPDLRHDFSYVSRDGNHYGISFIIQVRENEHAKMMMRDTLNLNINNDHVALMMDDKHGEAEHLINLLFRFIENMTEVTIEEYSEGSLTYMDDSRYNGIFFDERFSEL